MKLDQVWKEWNIDKLIGEGSFGKVYKIVREDFGHTYVAALKVIDIPQNKSEYLAIKNEGLTDESVQEYYKSVVGDIVDEFALMSQLKGNSNIVSYEDHAVIPKEDGFGWTICIRMELLTPLYSYLEKKQLTIGNVIQLGIDMCKALEVCQKYNIIHRDIKPENIFVSDIGTFKLGDFGIARQLENATSGMSKKGTYTYMAPEVYKGLEYDSSVDIYSLGIVLYRFLNNNRTPFMPPAPLQIKYSDKEQANLRRISGQKIPKPCNADGRLVEIVLKACAYAPGDRYESPYAMRQELQTVLYSEAERKLAYPEGDVLTNNKNEYEVDQKTETIKGLSENDKTVLLWDEKKKIEPRNNEIEEQCIISKENSSDFLSENIEQPTGKSKKGKVIGVLSLISVAILVTAIIGFVAISKQSDEVVVSSLLNMKISEAEKKLSSEGLVLAKEYLPSKTAEKGIIVSQTEKEGEKVKKGSVIHVVVCSAKIVSTPGVVDKDSDEAQKILESAGLKTKLVNKYSDEKNKGIVISQNPGEGEEIEEGKEVEVFVSKGHQLFSIPDVTGCKRSQAVSELKSIGMKVTVKENYSSSVAKGKVIKQSVAEHKKVQKGTLIKLIVSKGKKSKPKNQADKNISSNTSAKPKQDAVSVPKSNSQSTKPKKQDEQDEPTDTIEDWDLVN